MTRSKRLVLPLLVATCLALFAPTAGAQVIELQLWHGISAADYAGLEAVIALFNKEYEGRIVVKDTYSDWGPHYEKLQVATIAGIAPDIAYVQRDRLVEMVEKNVVRALDDLWEEAGWTEADFLPGAAAAMQHRGSYYAVPIDVYANLLYYNAQHLDEAGISGPPTNPEELISISKKVMRYDGTEVTRWGTRLPTGLSYFYTYLWQNGGDIYADSEYRVVSLADEGGQKAMNFINRMVFEERIAPPLPSAPWVFSQAATFTLDGIWWLRRAQDVRVSEGLNIQVAPADSLFGNDRKGVRVGSHTLVIPVRSNADPERIEAAKTFIKFMSDHNILWAQHGQLPVRMDAIRSPEFGALQDHQIIAQQVMVYIPNPPWFADSASVVGTMLNEAFNPSNQSFMAPVLALQKAAQTLQQRIDARF